VKRVAVIIARATIAVTVLCVGCSRETPGELIQLVRTVASELHADATARNVATAVGRDGWLFFAPELRHVTVGRFWGARAAEVSRARNADAADPLPAIRDFKAQLDDLDIELILVPVPPKSLLYADYLRDGLDLPDPLPRLDTAHQEFYATLREQGIDVLDLTEPFLDERFTSEGPLYCRQDTHWSGVGCVLAAQLIANVVRQRPWYADIATTDYAFDWETILINGDLREDLPSPPAPEELRVRRVVTQDERGPVEVVPDRRSPVVLLGDSHNLVFHVAGDMHTSGAGLADQLAYELGFPVDLVAVRGAGATPARVNLLRRAQSDRRYWDGKRLVIWCFSAREFTESDGWSPVPVTP
jgi:alginate O-acetyltransferase complex protein AlgJ